MEVGVGIKSLGSAFAVALVLAVASPAFAQQSPTGSWANEATGEYLYTAGMGGCTDGTYLYTVGGYQAGYSYPHEYYGRVRRYDPANNQWTNIGLLSTSVNSGTVYGIQYHAGDYWNGRIYMFGGYNYWGTVGTSSYSGGYTTNIRYFDLSTLTLTTVSATMPSTTYYHGAVTMGDRIYVAGGVSLSNLWVFNPSSGVLSNGPAMPGYLYYHGMAAVPAVGKVYALGGYGTSQYAGYCYEYTPGASDPANGSWANRSPMNTNTAGGGTTAPLYYTKAATMNNRIYATGYNATTGVQNMVLEYNAFTNQWTQRANSAYGHYYGHAFVAINNKGYSYGGYPNYQYGEEFTPPNFGSPPNNTVAVQVGATPDSSNQAQADPTIVDGWTNNQVTFSADVTDPDAAQQVRFRVQVKPSTAQWTQANQVTSLDTGLGAQGTKVLTFSIPAGVAYDWRWRIEDSFANSYPVDPSAWIDAFDNANSPDFRSDQEPPSNPQPSYPSNVDIQVNSPSAGPVLLMWQEATDNAPSVGISYELQVATDGGFLDIEAQLFSTAGTSEYPVTLSVSRYDKHWRMRARDIGGNFSDWSPSLHFRVTYNDGLDHSAGDAKKACGFTAAASPAIGTALLGAVLLALAAFRRKSA